MQSCERCRCPDYLHGDEISTRGWAVTPGGKLCTAFAPAPMRREPPTSDPHEREELYLKWQKHGARAMECRIPVNMDPPQVRQRLRERRLSYRGGPNHEVLAVMFFPGRGSVLVDIGS